MRAYEAILRCLATITDKDLSRRQRLHVLYVTALAQAAQDPSLAAVGTIDAALLLADELDEFEAQAELFVLRASVNRAILQVPDAARDLQRYLDLMVVHHQATPDEATPAIPDGADDLIDVLLHLAGSEFVLGHYDDASQLLDQVERFFSRAAGTDLQLALLNWTRALLLRWRGLYEVALVHAMAAADVYASAGEPGSASRIQTIVAEIAMDLAERFRRQHQMQACASFLVLAEPYLQRAVDLARLNAIESSEVMALITETRLHVLLGHPGDRKPLLRRCASRARQHQDNAVVAQAYTALGGEYEAVGNIRLAVRWYEKALAILNEAQLAALGVWAQRALWRLRGQP